MKRGPKNKTRERKLVLKYLKQGLTDKDSYTLAGIGHTQFYKWIKEDKKFKQEVEIARLYSKQVNLQIIQKASLKQWQASAWILERRFPEEFALKVKNEYDKPIKIELSSQGRTKAKKYID